MALPPVRAGGPIEAKVATSSTSFDAAPSAGESRRPVLPTLHSRKRNQGILPPKNVVFA